MAGKILAQKQWAPMLYSLYVEMPSFPFIAGQFTQLALEKEQVFRPYSLVNAPSESVLEFYYNVISEGTLTPILAALKEGDKLRVGEKGLGRFTLEEIPDAEILWLFATGTGLGPFLSILKTPEPWQRFSQIVLLHSVRYHWELTHSEWLQRWEKAYSKQFHWIPIVTRENIQGKLNERINTLLLSGKLETLLGLSLSSTTSQVMLCGNPDMVREVVEVLKARGLHIYHRHQGGHITTENYWK